LAHRARPWSRSQAKAAALKPQSRAPVLSVLHEAEFRTIWCGGGACLRWPGGWSSWCCACSSGTFAVRPEPTPLSGRCAAGGLPGGLAGPRGRENGWEVASGGVGWATRWARAVGGKGFEFPSMRAFLSSAFEHFLSFLCIDQLTLTYGFDAISTRTDGVHKWVAFGPHLACVWRGVPLYELFWATAD
jgi:hypothetical protein